MAKILISSIGTRGDVQPIVALALELKAMGHEATLCVAPDFKDWVESFRIAFVPIGPPLKGFSMRALGGKPKFSKEQIQKMVAASVRDQFKVMSEAATGADLIVSANALQSAAHSVAELLNIPYVYVAYCACTLSSWNHPPPRVRSQSLPPFVRELVWKLNERAHRLPRFVNGLLWKVHDRSWNVLFRSVVNEQRAEIGLPPIDNMVRYVTTDRPWLAADEALGPAQPSDMRIVQTGAWLLRDASALPDELERFLDHGAPPIYFGFGSTIAMQFSVQTLLETARKLGRRAIVAKGWANLELADTGDDCIAIGDVNHEKLFPRVAAIVHHGGAGTTTAAARAGRPQVIVPHLYDQFYWARRVEQLGIGASFQETSKSATENLVDTLRSVLSAETVARAAAIASRVQLNGANTAAERLVREFLKK